MLFPQRMEELEERSLWAHEDESREMLTDFEELVGVVAGHQAEFRGVLEILRCDDQEIRLVPSSDSSEPCPSECMPRD